MHKVYILAHDLGTTGDKATLYNTQGQLIASAFYAYDTIYTNHNWVEQNPDDWWQAVCHTTGQLIHGSGISARDIACVSFSGQMMGCVSVDKSGRSLRNAIIWADQRSLKEEKMLKDRLGHEKIYQITGHRASASYSGEKIMWLKNNEPEIYKDTYKFLHSKDYIVMKLTGSYVTDYSDASGMNLLDIKKLNWSDEILDIMNIDINKLPELHNSTDVVGYVCTEASDATGLWPGTPVVIGAGDGMCAATGAGVVNEGSAYNYLGSSSWIGIATREPIYDEMFRTFNWVHMVPGMYSPTGTMQSAGGSLQWFKNVLCDMECLLASYEDKCVYQVIDNKVAESQPGANGLLYLPYLLGERSPHWNPHARGAFIGMSMIHTKEDFCRAVLEGVTYNLKIILDIFDSKTVINEIKLIGGGAKSSIWRQIFADIFGKRIAKPHFLDEATSLGAAIAGGVGVGLFKDFSIAEKLVKVDEVQSPCPEYSERYSKLFEIFKLSYEQLIPVYDQLK